MTLPFLPVIPPRFAPVLARAEGTFSASSGAGSLSLTGPADASRHILAIQTWADAGGTGVPAIPLMNGVAMDLLYRVATSYGSDAQKLGFFARPYPTGSSVSLTGLTGGGGRGNFVSLFALYGLASLTAAEVLATTLGNGSAGSLNVTTQANAINLIGFATNGGTPVTTEMTGGKCEVFLIGTADYAGIDLLPDPGSTLYPTNGQGGPMAAVAIRKVPS